MSCCSNNLPKACPSRYAVWFPRIAFGLVLIGFGVNHYRNLNIFIVNAQRPFQSIPVIAAVAAALAYIVPALMIVGGVLFAVKQLCPISKLCILISLSGIIGWAALGILVASDPSAISGLAGAIQNPAVLIIFYYVIRKMSKCCGGTGAASCCPSQTTH